MIIKTRLFDLLDERYGSLSEAARAMGISVSQIYRVRAGDRRINQKFITGAIRAFPQHRFEDLFYLAPDLPEENQEAGMRHRHMARTLTGTAFLPRE